MSDKPEECFACGQEDAGNVGALKMCFTCYNDKHGPKLIEQEERIRELEAGETLTKAIGNAAYWQQRAEAAEAKVAAGLEICNSFMVGPTTRLEWLFGSQVHAALSDEGDAG